VSFEKDLAAADDKLRSFSGSLPHCCARFLDLLCFHYCCQWRYRIDYLVYFPKLVCILYRLQDFLLLCSHFSLFSEATERLPSPAKKTVRYCCLVCGRRKSYVHKVSIQFNNCVLSINRAETPGVINMVKRVNHVLFLDIYTKFSVKKINFYFENLVLSVTRRSCFLDYK